MPPERLEIKRAIMLSTCLRDRLFIDHIVLVISDLQRTIAFYTKVFGEPAYLGKESLMFIVGSTRLFLGLPYASLPENDRFSPNRIGLEHLAFGVKSFEELTLVERHLNENGIPHSGIHIDSHSKREKIWLNDPDGIRLEFFLRDE
jgi:glyoxylase I family protein